MTEMTSPAPLARPTGGLTYRLRQLQVVLALLFIAMIGLQVFFAGLGILVSPSYFAWHVSLGHFFALPIFGLFLLSLLGRSGWQSIGLTVVLFFLYGLQYAFIEGTEGSVRAFHALNALVLFGLALSLAKVSWQKVRAVAPSRSPQPRSVVRSLAGGGLVVLGAVVLFGVIFDNGPRAPGAEPSVMEPGQPAPVSDLSDANLGRTVFAETCSSCHGEAGEGGFGPSLASSTDLENAPQVIAQVLAGGGGMPAFGRLSDAAVAAVVSYVRSSWGNSFPSVTPEDVAALR